MKSLLWALVLAPVPLSAQQPERDPLVGIWGSETTFGPMLRGELTIRRGANEWRATIRTAEARFRPSKDSIRFDFPGGLGQFRGALQPDGRVIRGFWIQPPGVTLFYPFATPVSLNASGGDAWRGMVEPLPDRYSLYIAIRRATNGALVAAMRNPEHNAYPRVSQYRVTRVRDSVIFSAGADTNAPTIRLAATLDSVAPPLLVADRQTDAATYAGHQLSIRWPRLNRVLVLAQLQEPQAVGLFPRAGRGRIAYEPPVRTDDGWKIARASAVGFNETQLATLVQRIVDTNPVLLRAPLIHSLLVARRGRLVLEEYFYGHHRDQPHDTRSVGKTFSSVMLGAAMMRGAPLSPATRLAPLLAAQQPFANPDPRKGEITLQHLMTHTTGLACDDNDEKSPGNEDVMLNQRAQPDYWKYTMDVPMSRDPGTYYAYCSGTMNLMSGALTRGTGTWLPELFASTIARPLQFGQYHFNLSPSLEGYLGGGAFLRPRDLLKLGQVWLDDGVWNGKRIVPKAWVATSTTKHVEWPRRDENVGAGQDGLAWHLGTVTSGGRTYREYEANGNGGQLLLVIPALELVVVFTAGNYAFGGVWGRFRDDLLPNAIIPAIVR